MKPEVNGSVEEPDNPVPVAGDIIGDTAYSQRFVLKILLKLANLDTLKDEIEDKTFEDDLCILWDMTAERDVVLFLQKHDTLNLVNFALPIISSPRIIEIVIGIVGNMCCQKEIVAAVLKMDSFLNLLFEYSKSDDSLILVQLLRLVSSCLFLVEGDDITIWMDKFVGNDYSSSLYFILNNSSNKELLFTAIENFNTICSYCNTEKHRADFFTHFIRVEALESLSVAFTELTVNQKSDCNADELERILVVSLQITLNLVGFDKSPEIYKNSKENVLRMIYIILDYYVDKFVYQKEIDSDLIDVIESTTTIVKLLTISEVSDPEKFFNQTHKIWKSMYALKKPGEKGIDFEEDDKEELQDLLIKLKVPVCTLLCTYIAQCSEKNLFKVLDRIEKDYEEIVLLVKDTELVDEVSKRAQNFRTRLKETVDS